MMRRILLGFGLCVAFFAEAQERFGLVNSNYAGTDALSMNPARMATQWCWMDINFIGAGLFVLNDHVSVSSPSHSMLGEMRESLRSSQGDGFVFTESVRDGGRHAFVDVRVAGPAVALNLGRNSVGLSIASRFSLSLTGVDRPLARFMFNGLSFTPQHGIRYRDEHIRLTSAAWTELNGSYSRLLLARDFNLFSIGATARYLIAHGGVGLGFDVLDHTVVDTARAEIHEASGRYGLAMPAVDNGRGFGLDLGVVYERTLEEADGYVPHQDCEPLAYDWRLGASLLDLGGMHFREAMTGTFSASTSTFSDYTDIAVSDQAGLDSLVSASLSTFQRGGDLSIGLPTAFAVQFDKRVIDHVFIAVNCVQNLSLPSAMRLRRTNTVAMVPRFELRRFEAAVPIVVHEYDFARPSVGVMLRLNNIIIGTDDLLPLITHRALFSTDVYFRVKWTVFRSPVCRGRKHATHGVGGQMAMPCVLPE